ncbi:nucleolar protein 8 [Holotrichia oblita]|uniref:Nucleolar protein 8 n=1 Tax=Holotrichia oblita TaxID=644536 RepID=A0ACB9TJK4_HOLOL|nr:nucleolar protein 8 [Holotrichia oblita]
MHLKKGLFEDDESDENDKEYNFEVKEQFQGKKGRKLMELQLKFKNDKRFAMDDRFLEDNDVSNNEFEEDNAQNSKEVHESDIEVTAEEKQKEMAILEDILGGRLVKNKDSSKKKSSNSLGMIRYDPANPEHNKYILKQDQLAEQKSKKKRKEEHKSNEIHEAEKPVVSKETFYEVEENLKQALEEDKSFSLLTLFGTNKETVNNETTDAIVDDNETVQKNLFEIKDKNPFKYDSSDENSDNEAHSKAVEEEKESNLTGDRNNGQKISLGPSRLWRDPFFFKEDDYRFQEGIDFVKKFALDDRTEFKEVRRNIKEIVRAKVRNNQRKNKLFKKKLGGRRIARMKKALKNR